MKIIFAGTPELAVPALAALIASKHEVSMVLTQPDRPAGRGRKLKASAVKTFAQQHDIPVCQVESLKTPASVDMLCSLQADLMIVLAYGLIIPKTVLDIPKLGCINVHISLLPRWRGAAPTQRALLAGDSTTGVTLMQMDTGLDTGDILKHAPLTIRNDETTASLHERLGELGATTLMAALDDIAIGNLKATAQDEEKMTYAKKVSKDEARINWQLSAQEIERMVRAFNPWPIAFTTLNEARLRIWRAKVNYDLTDAPPGTIIAIDKNSISVACGKNVLQISEIQWAGSKTQTVHVALNANNNPLKIGVILGDV